MTAPSPLPGDNPHRGPGRQTGGRLKWLAAGALVLGLILAAPRLPLAEFLRRALDAVAGLGGWGPVLFVALYVVATVMLMPASVLTLGAGAVFGVVWGSVYVSCGATLGATAAFLIGRHLARDRVARHLAAHERFAALDRAVAAAGWKIVGLTRLSPVFPFTLLNYAFGLTQVRLRDYVFASWIGMLPGTVMYVYLGSLAQVATRNHDRPPGEWALYALGLLATVGVTVVITRLARLALTRSLQR